MFILFVVLSISLLAAVNWVAFHGTRKAIGLACLVAGGGAFLGLSCLGSVALALTGVCIALGGLICLGFAPRPAAFFKGSLAGMVCADALLTAAAVSDVREWAKLKERYPMESLADRLAYENRSRLPPGRGPATTSPNASSRQGDLGRGGTQERLVVLEGELNRNRWSAEMRARSLKHLHASCVEQFVSSPGFGVMRMVGRPSRFYLDSRDLGPVPLPTPAHQGPSPELETQPPGAGKAGATENRQPPPEQDRLATLHEESLVDFANPKRFGYVQDREHVAGFAPHQFTLMPEPGSGHEGGERWLVERLELVSLLKYEEPAVYVSDHLPRMDELREATTRPLDRFESEALAELRRGGDLKVQYGEGRLRMLGSIRAVRQCAGCHEVERGDLLGAFSYQLRRERLGREMGSVPGP